MTCLTPLRAAALAVALALPAAAQTAVGTAPAETVRAEMALSGMAPAVSAAVDTARVDVVIASFEAALTGGDIAGILDVMPPALLLHLADDVDIGAGEWRHQMIAATEAAMAEAEIEEFGMDFAAAETGRTPEERGNALVAATSTTAVEGSGRFRSANPTRALDDDGGSHLMRVDDPDQVALLRAVHPDMAEIASAEGTMEPVE